MSRISFYLLALIAIAFLASCSNDEDNLRPPPYAAGVINIAFEGATVMDVNSARHQAIVLTTGQDESRTALQLVDLSARSVTASRILTDYFELYDVKFISDSLACFAGRPHGFIGYAVQFFTLPSLTMSTQVIVTPETSGSAGFLAVDSAGTFAYYSHAGGGWHDAVYKIRVSDRSIVDADNDGHEPYAFDNQLLSGLFDGPAKIFYDHQHDRIVVANPAFITIIPGDVWGTLNRSDSLSYDQVPGVRHLGTPAGTDPDMMAFGANIFVFGGSSGNQPQLSRFGVNSTQLDLTRTLPRVQWWRNNPAIFIHPRADIVSAFVLYEDSAGVAIGQYGLDQLNEVQQSPYRTRTIPDTSISTFGLDTVSDKLIVADKDNPRLELISIE